MKKIAVILVFLLLLQAVPIETFNYGESTMTINKLVSMSDAELSVLTDKQIFEAITSSVNYTPDTEGKLSYDSKIIKVRVDLNISSFRKYRQIIYGVPFDKQSDYGGKVLDKSEPKYLGFNKSGDPMTNDKYPGANLGEEPPEKKWIVRTNQYGDSWKSFKDSSDDKNELFNHMLKTDTINTDAVGRYTLEEILQNTDGMSNLSSYIGKNNETLRQKLSSVAKLQSIPTFFSRGSFKMKHKYDGTTYYDTMEWERIKDFNGSITIEPEKKYIVMLPEEDEVTNRFKVTFHYNDKVSGGMDTSKLLPREIELNIGTLSQFVNKKNPTYTFTKTYKRNTLANGHVNPIKESASTTFNTLVGDDFTFDDDTSFDIEVKMQGGIGVDFTINHDGKQYGDDSEINLGEGNWDSTDDNITVNLKDDILLDSTLMDTVSDLKVVSWNWYIKKPLGEYVQIGEPLINSNMDYTLSFGSEFLDDKRDIKNPDVIISTVEFKLEAMDSEGNKGEMTHTVKITGTPPPPPIDPTDNIRPVAEIKIKTPLRAGQRGKVSGSRSTDEDGRIIDYDWAVKHAEFTNGDSDYTHGEYHKFYVLEVEDNLWAKLVVTDNNNEESAEAEKRFDVINPLIPIISTYGTLKENRRITISGDKSDGTRYYPIDWDKTEWEITPLDGQNPDSIKLDTNKSGREFDTLFKETGRYKIKMKIYATCTFEGYEHLTYNNEIEKIIEIKPDEKPIADMALRKMVYRNPDTSGIAVLNMADNSRSIDGDFIGHRKWSYAFDSNNDGSFNDEVFNVASDENDVMVQIEVNKVGNYLIKLEITEEFGQPTIERFVTPEDRRKDDNRDIPREDRTAEVLNVAPTVEFNFDERKQVDLILLTDYEGQDLMDLRDQVESLKMRLQEQKVDAEIYIFDNTDSSNWETIGKLNDPLYNFGKKVVAYWSWDEEVHYDYIYGNRYVTKLRNTHYNTYLGSFEPFACRLSQIANKESIDNGYYAKIVKKERVDTYYKGFDFNYYIKLYDKDNNGVDSSIYNGNLFFKVVEDYYEQKDSNEDRNHVLRDDIRGPNIVIQQYFSPISKVQDVWDNYQALDVGKIKDIKFRDSSDRYLIMCSNRRNSLGLLDENFNTFLRENRIVTRSTLSEVYREFYARYYDFNEIVATAKAIYVKTPFGTKFKIGNDSIGSTSVLDFTEDTVDFNDQPKNISRDMTSNLITSGSISLNNGIKYKYHRSHGKMKGNYSSAFGGTVSLNGGLLQSTIWRPPDKDTYNGVNVDREIDRDVEWMYKLSSTSRIQRSYDNNSTIPICVGGGIIYKTKEGKYFYIHNSHNGSHSTKLSERYCSTQYVWCPSLTKNKLEIDDVVATGDNFILGRNGNLYAFVPHYNIDKTMHLIKNVDKVYNLYKGVAGTTKDGKGFYIGLGEVIRRSDIPVEVQKDIAPGRKIDKMTGNSKLVTWICDDNTIGGYGLALYGQFHQVAPKKKGDLSEVYYPVKVDDIYNPQTQIDSENSNINFICPMDIVVNNVRNRYYQIGEENLLCQDIYNIYKKEDTDSATILLNTKANMSTFYSDYEDDPLYDYRWDVVHDEKYFENDLGKDPRAKLNGEPIDEFTYTGHYKIDLKVQDNPVGDDDRFDNYRLWNKDETTLNIYVHRKPVVRDGIYAKKKASNLHVYANDEGSYDLDHLSKGNKGIREHDWYWRTDRNKIWRNERLDLYDAAYNTSYYVCHRVKDEEGQWSDFKYSEITIEEDIPIVLSANLESYSSKFDIDSMPVDERIKLSDIKVTYYDDVNLTVSIEKNGALIKELLSRDSNTDGIIKNETGFEYADIVERLPHNLDDGDYSVKILATDLSDTSKKASLVLPFKVSTPIDLRPILPEQAVVGETAKISCSSSVYTDKVVLTAFNDDAGIKKEYDMTLKESNSTRKVWTADVDIPWECKDQDYEFKFVGTVETDTPKSEELVEDMRIVVLEIAEIGIKGYWNHWRGQENMFGERMTVEPHRFLSHETVIIYGYIAGNPDKVYVEFSPQLEAMFFTDPAGNEYSYEEDIGYTVDFPLEMPLEKYRYYEVEYQLPIAWTTIDWDNNRVRNSYWMKITAEKSGVKVSEQFDDIEITGTVYDLLYVQPYHKPEK